MTQVQAGKNASPKIRTLHELIPIKTSTVLTERERIDFVTEQATIVVSELALTKDAKNDHERLQLRAKLLGNMMVKLKMIDPVETDTQRSALVNTVQQAETAAQNESFYRLYNQYGDHPLVRPIDVASEEIDPRSAADARLMIQAAAMLLISNSAEHPL